MTVNIHFEGPVDVVLREMQKLLEGGGSSVRHTSNDARPREQQKTDCPSAAQVSSEAANPDYEKIMGEAASTSNPTSGGDVVETAGASGDMALASDGETMIPYDERIHTGGENKIAQSGKWIKKRGVADSLVKEVEAELMAGAPKVETPADEPEQPEAEQVEEADPQDAADEKAEVEANREGLTVDDLRNACSEYVDARGIAAAQSDIPVILKRVAGVAKVPEVPAAKLQAAIDAVKSAAAEAAVEESDETKAAPTATKDDVKAVLKYYAQKYGGEAVEADARELFKRALPDLNVSKISELPEDGEQLYKVLVGAKQMLEKNPFNREAVDG